jgi:cytochrome c biogenesis protein CcmG, thiol:disulfide interchange protein DsbE
MSLTTLAATGLRKGIRLHAGTESRKLFRSLTKLVLVFLIARSIVPSCLAAPPVARSLVNKPAPEIARADLNGTRVTLKSLRGKVVLLNFWATWCAPCQIEMPVFSQWQQQYGPRGFQVIGISMDDDAAPVRKLLAKLKTNYPNAMGDAQLGERYGGVMGLPLSFLIDRKGVVRARFQGETDLKTIERELNAMLNQH